MRRGPSKGSQVADLQQAKDSMEGWSEFILLCTEDRPVI